MQTPESPQISRRLALAGLASMAAGLTGCVARGSVADGSKLSANQGVLVLQLACNTGGVLTYMPAGEINASLRISEATLGAKGAVQLIDGERYYVLPVDAGDYMWSKLMLDRAGAQLYGEQRFSIRAGVISYVGHIRLAVDYGARRFTVAVVDREADMRQYLKAQFPSYSASMPFEKTLTPFQARAA